MECSPAKIGPWARQVKGSSVPFFARTYTVVHHRDALYLFANREIRLEEVLKNHKEEQVILCDPEERRAWMVPFPNVLLHMVILRIKSDGYSASCATLPFAEVGPDGAAEAFKMLTRSRATIWHENEGDQGYPLGGLIKMLLIALRNAYPGMNRATFVNDKVLGLELMGLITCKPPFRLKKVQISVAPLGLASFARDIQLVLICRGLGETLGPSAAILPAICLSWRELSKVVDSSLLPSEVFNTLR